MALQNFFCNDLMHIKFIKLYSVTYYKIKYINLIII